MKLSLITRLSLIRIHSSQSCKCNVTIVFKLGVVLVALPWTRFYVLYRFGQSLGGPVYEGKNWVIVGHFSLDIKELYEFQIDMFLFITLVIVHTLSYVLYNFILSYKFDYENQIYNWVGKFLDKSQYYLKCFCWMQSCSRPPL